MKSSATPTDVRYRRRRLEMLIFLGVCVVGIFALGKGLQGLVNGHTGIDLGWLAMAIGAFWVLFAQMCRVQQSWPRKPDDDRGRQTSGRAKEK